MNKKNNFSREQIEKILSILTKIGFTFYKHDSDSDEPLVKAPNGQIVSMFVAYEFVRSQVAKKASEGYSSNKLNQPSNINVISSESITLEQVVDFVNNLVSNQTENQDQDGNAENGINSNLESSVDKTPDNSLEIIENREKTKIVRFEENRKIINNNNTVLVSTVSSDNKNNKKNSISFPKPYGIGFDPKSFDPTNLKEVKEFVDSNLSQKDNNDSKKWLATAFDKWLDEFLQQNNE